MESAPITSQNILPSIIYLRIDRAGEPEPDGDGVVDKGVDQGRGEALVPPRHGPTQDDGGGRERHIHTPGKDDDGHKGLRPVGLVDWHCRKNYAAGEEGGHGDEHYGRGAEVTQDQTRGDGSPYPAYGDGNETEQTWVEGSDPSGPRENSRCRRQRCRSWTSQRWCKPGWRRSRFPGRRRGSGGGASSSRWGRRQRRWRCR